MQTVVLPCKIGDQVWAIRNCCGRLKAFEGRVSEMYFTENMKLCIVVFRLARGTWGDRIFTTKEDAHRAIEERKKLWYIKRLIRIRLLRNCWTGA